MPRPCCCRRIGKLPNHTHFKPRGIPLSELEEVRLRLDELEALRLADVEGLYHEEAAARMNVSRQTFDRIVAEARKTVADALVGGKAILIEGGNVTIQRGKGRCMRHGQQKGGRP